MISLGDRSRLHADWVQLKSALRAWFDWKQHVRAHPRTAVALGVLLGLLFVRNPVAFGAVALTAGRSMAWIAGRAILAPALASLRQNAGRR